MRHFPHRIKVTHTSPLPGSPEVTKHESLMSRFSFIDAVKNEQIFGAQYAQGAVFLPRHVRLVEDGTLLDEYRFYLVSPTPNDLVSSMKPLSEKWTPVFRYLQVQIFQY